MRIALFALTMLIGPIAVGYLFAGDQGEAHEEFSLSKDGGNRNELTLKNINGTIVIKGVEGRHDVRITGRKSVSALSDDDARSHLADIKVDVAETGSGLTITSVHPDGEFGRSYKVDYTIEVPNSWKVTVENTNGDVTMADIRNEVAATVTNGALRTKEIAGSVTGDVTNGEITTDATLPEHGTCHLETVNGEIVARLVVPPSAKCRLGTTNGDVTLRIPKNSSAGITAGSTTGDVTVEDLSFTRRSKTQDDDDGDGSSFSGTMGDGKGTIEVSVTNGDIGLKGF